MSTFTEYQSVSYVTLRCCSCGVSFALESTFQQERRNNGGNFYCPNGHTQVYRESTVKELERKLEDRERELRAAKCETLAEKFKREHAENQKTRLEKRIQRGVCPKCNRSFTNLRRHMDSKHKCKA